jgi:hypothetical protein
MLICTSLVVPQSKVRMVSKLYLLTSMCCLVRPKVQLCQSHPVLFLSFSVVPPSHLNNPGRTQQLARWSPPPDLGGSRQSTSIMLKFRGCSSFRQRLLLSTLSGRAVRIDDIRADDASPGLRDFEASFLRLLEKLTNGCVVEINETGWSAGTEPGLHGKHLRRLLAVVPCRHLPSLPPWHHRLRTRASP